jgi:hypothetical protein
MQEIYLSPTTINQDHIWGKSKYRISLLITMKRLTPEHLFAFLWELIIFIVKTVKNNFFGNKMWKLVDNIKMALQNSSCEVG